MSKHCFTGCLLLYKNLKYKNNNNNISLLLIQIINVTIYFKHARKNIVRSEFWIIYL